ncbi:hypothetical protein PU646_26595, partial [Klebsiella pneumoniae]
LLLCHGMVCVVGRMRDLILQLSKSSIYSTKPPSGNTLASCQTSRDQSGSRVCCTGEFYCISHSLYRCKFKGEAESKKTKKRRKSS